MSPSESKNQWPNRLPQIAIIVAWSSGLCGTVWAVAADHSEVFNRLRNVDAQMADHEVRLRAMEKQLDGIAVDVKWIRQTLEQQQSTRAFSTPGPVLGPAPGNGGKP